MKEGRNEDFNLKVENIMKYINMKPAQGGIGGLGSGYTGQSGQGNGLWDRKKGLGAFQECSE